MILIHCAVGNVVIKPKVQSLVSQTISSYFYMARSMQINGSSIFGFQKNDNTDIHLSKNSEWAAASYLSQSKYGKYGNPNYTGTNKELYQNKSFVTGNSNGTPSTSTTKTQIAYDVEGTGTGASTTGNITGIYDMSGAGWEQVMANYNKTIGSSGFTTLPDSKYYDLYTTTNEATACDGGVCY